MRSDVLFQYKHLKLAKINHYMSHFLNRHVHMLKQISQLTSYIKYSSELIVECNRVKAAQLHGWEDNVGIKVAEPAVLIAC